MNAVILDEIIKLESSIDKYWNVYDGEELMDESIKLLERKIELKQQLVLKLSESPRELNIKDNYNYELNLEPVGDNKWKVKTQFKQKADELDLEKSIDEVFSLITFRKMEDEDLKKIKDLLN